MFSRKQITPEQNDEFTKKYLEIKRDYADSMVKIQESGIKREKQTEEFLALVRNIDETLTQILKRLPPK